MRRDGEASSICQGLYEICEALSLLKGLGHEYKRQTRGTDTLAATLLKRLFEISTTGISPGRTHYHNNRPNLLSMSRCTLCDVQTVSSVPSS